MKKLFISQPYGDRSEEEVMKERDEILAIVMERTGEIFEVIDQYHVVAPDGSPRLYNLSHDILLMGDADLIAFSPKWRDAPGCCVEHEVAYRYKLPMIDLTEAGLYTVMLSHQNRLLADGATITAMAIFGNEEVKIEYTSRDGKSHELGIRAKPDGGYWIKNVTFEL